METKQKRKRWLCRKRKEKGRERKEKRKDKTLIKVKNMANKMNGEILCVRPVCVDDLEFKKIFGAHRFGHIKKKKQLHSKQSEAPNKGRGQSLYVCIQTHTDTPGLEFLPNRKQWHTSLSMKCLD